MLQVYHPKASSKRLGKSRSVFFESLDLRWALVAPSLQRAQPPLRKGKSSTQGPLSTSMIVGEGVIHHEIQSKPSDFLVNASHRHLW